MKNLLINLSLHHIPFTALSGFAQKIHDGFASHAVDYPAPNPALFTFQLHIDALNLAIAAWGEKGNRGSHVDYLALREAAAVVRNDLRSLSNYARNTKPNDADSWAELGFVIKLPKTEPQPLQMVQNFHHFICRNLPLHAIKLRWEKPLGAETWNVKFYVIQRSNTSENPAKAANGMLKNILACSTSTFFIDKNPFVGENWYWITAVGAKGYGVTSEGVMVVSSKLKD